MRATKKYENEMDLCSDLLIFLREEKRETPFLFVEYDHTLSIRLVKYFEDEKTFNHFVGNRKTVYPRLILVENENPYYEFYGSTVGVIFEKHRTENKFHIQTYRKLLSSQKTA